MGIELAGRREVSVVTAEGDRGEEWCREVKEDSRGGAKVRV